MGDCCCPEPPSGDGAGCFYLILFVIGYAIYEFIVAYWMPILIVSTLITILYFLLKK